MASRPLGRGRDQDWEHAQVWYISCPDELFIKRRQGVLYLALAQGHSDAHEARITGGPAESIPNGKTRGASVHLDE